VSGGRSSNIHADYPYLSIVWDGERNCVHAEFKGFATTAEFRAGTMNILDAIRERKSPSLISDNRRLEVVTSEDQLWIRDTWVPEAAASGLKRIAVVVAHRGLGRYASQEIINQFPNGVFTTRTFASVDEARAWLAAEDQPAK
jgi:stage II sporulation SpoAA-like protein